MAWSIEALVAKAVPALSKCAVSVATPKQNKITAPDFELNFLFVS